MKSNTLLMNANCGMRIAEWRPFPSLRSLRLLLLKSVLALLLAGCAQTPNQIRDRQLYRAMQFEWRAMQLEYGNATNVHMLQHMIDAHGFERSRIEGYMK